MEMQFGYTPPPSAERDFDDMTDEELDLYFANYVPLSNLPTPPPAKEQRLQPTADDLSNTETRAARILPEQEPRWHKSHKLEAQARCLSTLVPTNVSPRRPDVAVIVGFLERARLPAEVVAFAACVLDALSMRFAQSWRESTSTAQGCPETSMFWGPGYPSCVPCEIVVLSALAIAHGFLSDGERDTKHWAECEGGGLFSVKELEQTKWSILQDIDYGLMRIENATVQRMLREMQNAAGRLEPKTCPEVKHTVRTEKDKSPLKLNLESYQGAAVWMNGVQTPEPSP